jgi:hypothetical protein
VLGRVIRKLLLWPLDKFFLGSLIYPALILFVLVLAGQSTGLVASPG